MNFDFSDDQKTLRDHAALFLRETCTTTRLRHCTESGQSFDRELWQQMAELGWTALSIPEAQGGLGLGALELCVLSEELGRVLAPVPFFSTVCLGAEILKACSTPEANAWLERIATGDAIVAVSTSNENNFIFENGTINGSEKAIAYLAEADCVIVTARDVRGVPVLALIDLNAAGIERQSLDGGIDDLRPYASLHLHNASATVLLIDTAAAQLHERIVNQAAILTAFEQIGGGEAAMSMAREYTLQRYAFGRPIAGYQAVKHKLADMAVQLELARSNAYFGAWAMETAAPELTLAAAVARVSATEAFDYAAEECLHLHGGIGYTWEADCHFFYKRARLLAISLGNIGEWCERLLDAA